MIAQIEIKVETYFGCGCCMRDSVRNGRLLADEYGAEDTDGLLRFKISTAVVARSRTLSIHL